MSRPLVTVVVPGHDVGPWVGEALASLRAQTLREWVAVLVDDGSTDDTAALFDAAAASDPRFRVTRHDRRRGLSAARNTGTDLVTTRYLGFLDADDRMRPDALARLVGSLEASGSDVAVGAYVRLRPDGSGGYRAGEVQPWVGAATAPEARGLRLADRPAVTGNIVAWSKVSRTDFWRGAGLRFPEGRMYEDQVVAQQLYTRASAFDTVPYVVVEWRERADGSSITQHVGDLPVLHQYLDAMAEGVAVLTEAGDAAAVAARVALIRAMDVPALAARAAVHPDPAYREALDAFLLSLPA